MTKGNHQNNMELPLSDVGW